MDASFRGNDEFERGLEILGYDPFAHLDEGTRYQQPAIFLCDVAAWRAADLPGEPIAAAGHSLGEYAALVAAGAVAYDDAVRLVDARAAAMARAAEQQRGGMVAMLGGDESAVRELAAELGLTVANDNAPGQLVLAGAIDALDAAEERARDTGARARRLPVSGAFHSPLMAPAADDLRKALAETTFSEPRFPVYSNGTARPFEDIPGELAENLLRSVRFRESLLAMHAAGADEMIELGPGKVLAGLVKRTLREISAAGGGAR
jgi:[acyl-carrier-protein] S-malonyltransferase